MRIENQALKRLISNNPLAETYAKEGFSNMGEQLDEKVADYLHNQVIIYSKLTAIKEKIFSGRDIGDKLEAAIDLMPGMAFSVPARFKVDGRPGLSLRQIQIAVLDSAMNRYRESRTFVDAFLAAVPYSSTVAELGGQLQTEGGDESFMPRQVMLEFGQIAQRLLSLPIGVSRPEQIENYYIFQAYTQIFFQFYTELLLKAPSLVVVGVVQAVFAYILAALRRFEINHFHKPGHPNIEQVEHWIDKDSAQTRHPNLRKHIFGYVSNYYPMIKVGGTQSLSATGQRSLQNQLVSLKKVGPERFSLILMDLRKFRGSGAVMFILGQMQRNYLDVLQGLEKYLPTSEAPQAADLSKLVALVLPKEKIKHEVMKQRKPGFAVQSEESKRLARAKKNLAEFDTAGAMNQHKVEEYLKNRLEKIYARARIEGALTQDKIPAYLSQFTDSTGTIVGKQKLSSQEASQFASSAAGIVEEIGADGALTPDEIKEKQAKITELGSQLATADSDEAKTEIITAIGDQLMDSQNEVEARLPEEERKSVEFEKLRDSQIISIGTERNCPMVTVGEFFLFPIGVEEEMDEENWFKFHLKYLDLLVEDRILTQEKRDLIDQLHHEFEKIKYRKYFDIFPNDKFDDSILSAVYSLWDNNGLERLRLSKSA